MQLFSLINLRSFFLAIVPVLGIYLILPGITLDILLLFLLLILEILFKRKIVINFKIFLFFFILIIGNVISYLFSSTSVTSIFINNSFQIVNYAVLLCYFVQQPVNSVFVKTLHIFGVFASVFVLFQFISFWVFNQSITLFLPINTSVEDLDLLVSITRGRPNSIFLEPAHYALFILPILFNAIVEKKYVLSSVYILGLLFSTSTTGFAILIIMLIYHFVFQIRNFKFVLIIGLLFFPLLFLNDYSELLFESNFDKLGADSVGENDRLLGTVPLIFRMDFFSWFFGLGYGQMSDFFKTQGIFVGNYSNSYLMCFFSFGLVGLISFVFYLLSLFKSNSNKGYFFIFLLVLSSDQVLFNRNFFYLVCCIYFLNDFKLKDEIYVTQAI